MLQALTRFFRRCTDRAQLSLDLDPRPRTADELLARLTRLGLSGIGRCRLTRNRAVMVSYRDGELRVHQGYLAAPDEVLRAVVTFVNGRSRAQKREAQRVILGYHIERPARVRRQEVTRSDDAPMARTLAEWHGRFNARHFHGKLSSVPIRVSRRLQSRLGHYTAAAPTGEPAEIVIGRRHIRRHGWDEALHTLLHEMVHQWQDESGHAIDHGRTFRRKAREVGIAASARRAVVPKTARRETPEHEQLAVGLRAAREG